MSACPTFSNLTFSRVPDKPCCILFPLLLTYPCAFGSLVWEQLVEMLLQNGQRVQSLLRLIGPRGSSGETALIQSEGSMLSQLHPI
jgi:hypothetical protein